MELISLVSGTLLNFNKKNKDKLRVILDQWLKLQLGLDALGNLKNLKMYLVFMPYTLQKP